MNLNTRPALLSMNCASSKLACIDIHGAMSMWGLDMDNDNAVKRSQAEKLEFERKDAWDVCWSDDDDDMFAVLEKAKMYVFRNLNPQEPVTSSGYLCKFSQLQITSIQLDELIKDPENPTKVPRRALITIYGRITLDSAPFVGVPRRARNPLPPRRQGMAHKHAFEPHFNADEPYFDPILTPF
jgi:hypothetical protein